ncbi:MAG: orotate phosphoribosyltransferase, partial [Firmicutes bacterium]|nr:orotate phosphoribosyltransferase [Bacillota bacterium]
MTNSEALKLFEESSAILKGHFLLTSGRHSDTYMQCAKLFVNPKIAEIICAELVKKISAFKIDYVASPAIGGIIMGYEIARQLKVPNIFFERENGQMTLRRGFELKKNSNVLVV